MKPYVTNINDNKVKRTHRVSLFIDQNTAVYFDSFLIKYIPQEVLNKSKIKLLRNNIFVIQDSESIMCGYYGITFIEYMLAWKTWLNYISVFSPNDYKKNNKIIYYYFKDKYFKSQSLD